MKKNIFLLIAITFYACNSKQPTRTDFITLFETSNATETPEYAQVISYYKDLSNSYSEISMFEMGQTDSGNPLHLVVLNTDGKTRLSSLKDSKKNKMLINNGIHPGESDGIDATMMLFRDIVQNDSLKQAYQNTIIATIPVYNIGGALNRNSHSRTNQNGPKEYGFRGNTQNYDLNRDFVKQDTKNAASFAEIFHLIDPDVFIDNHVSNGADYKYVTTHLFTQHNKLGGDLGVFLETQMRPAIESSMAQKSMPITPYVNVWGGTPKSGFWAQFMDSPRYSTGYTTLFNTLGMMVETHMLKPYRDRVEENYEIMLSMLDFTEKRSSDIKSLRTKAVKSILEKQTYPIAYKVNREKPSTFMFRGYEGEYIDSKVTNGKRLFYDRSKPFLEPLNYYNTYDVSKEVSIPRAYVLKNGWNRVLERLENNQIQFQRLEKDSVMNVVSFHVEDFKTRDAYEGHYLHYNTSVKADTLDLRFSKGDIIIPTNQKGIRYILETLEPEAVDSFFNWNFFDTVLQQKEGYSSYVFEDIAEQFLKDHTMVKNEFEEKLASDKKFANNPRAQLNFIFKKTPHYEPAHMLLPIYKLN